MTRIYHHYSVWEDYLNGMWRKPTSSDVEKYLPIAIEFTGNHELYGSYMMKVANEWKISCEHNLTDTDQNRRAWIGHAAACMAKQIPESVTRMAWSSLTDEQRYMANMQADKAIAYWEMKNGFGGLYAKELFDE